MVARVHGFFETSYRIPRTLKETARISVPTFLYESFLKGLLPLSRPARIQRLKRLIVPVSISMDFLSSCISSPPPSILYLFHTTWNPLLFPIAGFRGVGSILNLIIVDRYEIQMTNSNSGIRSQNRAIH